MTEELKPCPFCGSEKIGKSYINLGATGLPQYMVYCKECKSAICHVIPSEASMTYVYDATKMWNRRVSE